MVKNAGDRGTLVHNICESIIRGLGEWGITEEVMPYVDSFKKWWERGVNVLSIEQRFYCATHMITGKIDLIIGTPENACILDLKTSSKESKTWPLQGSAYKYLATQAGYNITGIQFLHLSKKGKEPKLFEYADQFPLYLSCLDVYRYFYGGKNATR